MGIECVGAEVGGDDVFDVGGDDGVSEGAVVGGEEGGVEGFDYGVLILEESGEGGWGGVVYCC